MHNDKKLSNQEYVNYLCFELEKVASGKTKRLVINLPPRHLKTFLAAICMAAWTLARDPASRIIIITYNEDLAEHISLHVRRVLQSDWYREIFTKTRIAEDRARAGDFETTRGGAVYAVSSGGALAGRGADLIIFDDPLDLKDANNVVEIQRGIERFDNLIMSRLNNPEEGRVVIIAHRLNENDLSAHVRNEGGWSCAPSLGHTHQDLRSGPYGVEAQEGGHTPPRRVGS